MHAHTYTHTHTYTQTHPHPYPHTHTHTHKHTQQGDAHLQLSQLIGTPVLLEPTTPHTHTRCPRMVTDNVASAHFVRHRHTTPFLARGLQRPYTTTFLAREAPYTTTFLARKVQLLISLQLLLQFRRRCIITYLSLLAQGVPSPINKNASFWAGCQIFHLKRPPCPLLSLCAPRGAGGRWQPFSSIRYGEAYRRTCRIRVASSASVLRSFFILRSREERERKRERESARARARERERARESQRAREREGGRESETERESTRCFRHTQRLHLS